MKVDAPIPRIALTPAEAAAAMGCGTTYFEDHVAPDLRWFRRGRKRFVAVTELQRYVVEQSEAPMVEQVSR